MWMLQKTRGYFVIQSPDHCKHECQKHTKSKDWCIVNGTSNFRWILDGGREGLVRFFLMIFFTVTASPTLLFPTSPFPQNSHVQNKVWPSWKLESLADVPPGKERGLCQKQQGCLGKRGGWRRKLQTKLSCTSLGRANSVTFAKHGSVTPSVSTPAVPMDARPRLLRQPFEGTHRKEVFYPPFSGFFAVGWVSILAHHQYDELQGEHCQGPATGWRKSRNSFLAQPVENQLGCDICTPPAS